MATKGQIRFLTDRIEGLEQQRQKIHMVVDQYIDQVLEDGKSWLQSKETIGQNYQDICMNLSTAMIFVIDKYEEISDVLDRQGDETEESESSTEATSSSTTVTTSTSSQPTTFSSSSTRSVTRPSLLADHLLLKLQERIDIIEGQMINMTEKVDEIQEIKAGMGEMKKKMKNHEETSNKTLEKLQGQLETSSKEYIANKTKDSKWFKQFEEKIGGLGQDTNRLSADVEGMKEGQSKTDKRITKLDKEREKIEERLYDVEMEQEEEDTKLKTLEERMKTWEKKYEKVEELDEKIRCMEDERNGKDNDRMNEVEERLRKTEENMTDVETQKLRALEDRLDEVEDERRNDLKVLGDMKSEVSSLSSRVQVVEKRHHPAIGFTACNPAGSTLSLTHDTVVKDFPHIVSNKGDHYSNTTGIFTSPVDGVYVVALSHLQRGTGNVCLHVVCERVNPGPGGEREEIVCQTWTRDDCTSCCDVSVVEMMKGDRFFVRSRYDGMIGFPSGFSCYYVG